MTTSDLRRFAGTAAIDVAGASVIDGGGRTLIPGLIDSHVHFSAYISVAMTGPNDPYPEGRLGVIETGAYADVLLVQGNPLDDPEILTDPGNNLHLVMKDGVIHKNAL